MENEVKCSINLEWTNKQGIIQRKLQHKSAFLKLIRNNRKEIYIEITSTEKSALPQRLHLKDISVFNKFMQEGKATIKFQSILCSLYISNAPPGQLATFFRTLFVKIIGDKQDAPKKTSLRTQVLTNRTQQYNEISPVTNGELERIIKATTSKSTSTTPSPLASKKRKIEHDEDSKAAKKLFVSSPLPEPLTIEQKAVLDACLAGNNIFFTGSAGTGKSYLLKKIIQSLPPDVTIATASTGVAACHIGGTTLHQFAGIGTGESSLENCIKLAQKSSINWRKCKHLIIDEISMVEGQYFEKIEKVARVIRKNEKPFGGIQLILCGDFLQLPPVVKTSQPKNFCFQTTAWEQCRFITMELKQVHRQTDDIFISILNKIRVGKVDDSVVRALKATASQKIEKDGILATTLCSLTRDADAMNNSKLAELKSELKCYQAEDSIPSMSKQLDQLTSIPSKIDLKIGAQVMLLKNINVSQGLVNGARGVVKSFRDGLPLVKFRNNKEYLAKQSSFSIKLSNGSILTRKQVPLKLAWAFSIHKSQGLTLDCVEMSLERVFEAGQAYVALSRAQSLDTLRVLDFKSTQVWANPDVLKFYENLNEMKFIPLGPIVQNKEKKSVKRWPSKSKLFDKPIMNIN